MVLILKFSIVDWLKNPPIAGVCLVPIIAAIFLAFQRIFYHLYLHPLTALPGPKIAAVTTKWWAYVECVLGKSRCDVLEELHGKYGPIVRVGPDELHFSNPQAYHDIHNSKNRWDKEAKLYHSFGEDRSSFGFLTYKEAKERKDVLGRMFSVKAVTEAQDLVTEKIDALCAALQRESSAGKPADLFWAFRCLTMDIITYLCFGQSVDAINSPGFQAPILEAMDTSLLVFVWFKHSELYKNMILKCPPSISRTFSPSTRGLVDLQQMTKRQIRELAQHPENLKHLPHKMTIYHQLLDKEAYRTNTVPCEGSLYEEAQVMMFAGSDTTGNALMVGTFHLLKQPETYSRFKKEVMSVWPNLSDDPPALRELERLPYFNAVIKEALRLSVGLLSGLSRVVPKEGAKICDIFVPGGTIVSCGATFVHFNSTLFPSPQEFRPERWLEDPELENWLVPFSRGPRMCLGINLAWLELRLTFAHIFRKFDMELAGGSPDKLQFRDCFLPFFYGPHVLATMTVAVT